MAIIHPFITGLYSLWSSLMLFMYILLPPTPHTSSTPPPRLCATMDLTFSPQSSNSQSVTLGSVVHLGKWQHIVINILPASMEPVYKVRDDVHFAYPKKKSSNLNCMQLWYVFLSTHNCYPYRPSSFPTTSSSILTACTPSLEPSCLLIYTITIVLPKMLLQCRCCTLVVQQFFS